jgi:prevent-host-death family protein
MLAAVREFKANLSEYPARVQAGESLEIASHKKPIARLTGIGKSTEAKLQAMAAKGLTTLSKKPSKCPNRSRSRVASH